MKFLNSPALVPSEETAGCVIFRFTNLLNFPRLQNVRLLIPHSAKYLGPSCPFYEIWNFMKDHHANGMRGRIYFAEA